MKRSILILLIALILTLVVMSVRTTIDSTTQHPDETKLPNQTGRFVTADFEPNGTLVVDGVTVSFESDQITQTGNILVTNGGCLIVRNSVFSFLQLAPYQYGVTIEKASELRFENSSFSTKYPVSWLIDSSNTTLTGSLAAQCYLSAKGISSLLISGSCVSGVSLTDVCELTAHDSEIGAMSMDSNTQATLLNTTAAGIQQSDVSSLDADVLRCSQLMLSDDSLCSITSIETGELHLWERTEASVSGGSVGDLGLYDSTSIVISGCSVGYLLIRSSLFQTLDTLSIERLECSHYTQVAVNNCTIGSMLATGHSDLSVSSCEIGAAEYMDWSTGIVTATNMSSVVCTHSSSWVFTGVRADSFECSREAVVSIRDSWTFNLYAWNFNGTTWSHGPVLRISDSFLHVLNAGYWTVNVMNNCVVEYASYYHYSIFNITHTDLDYLALGIEAKGHLFQCNVSLLTTRDTIDVTLHSSRVAWRIEPTSDTHMIANLPLGSISFWNPLANASFDAVNYNITLLDCVVEDLKIIIGYSIACDMYNSSFSWAGVCDTSYANFTSCIITELSCNGDLVMKNCTLEYITAGTRSIGYVEHCQIGHLTVQDWADWTTQNSDISHVAVGGWDGARLLLDDCNSTSLSVTGTGEAELKDCYVGEIRTYNYIHITATDCVIDIWYNADIDYPTAIAVNCTLGIITAIAHTTLTLLNCEVDYYATRDYALTLIENCTFNQFVTNGWTQVTIRGSFSWSTYCRIADESRVYREFVVFVVFENGTSSPLTDYVVFTAANLTVHTGTTSSGGTGQFTLVFNRLNYAEFDDQYYVSVNTITLFGASWFNVSSDPPIWVVVEEQPLPLQPPEVPLIEFTENSTQFEDVDVRVVPEARESPPQRETRTGTDWRMPPLTVYGFVVGASTGVAAFVNVAHQPSPRIASSRRSQYEER